MSIVANIQSPDFSLFKPQEKSRVWEVAYLIISIVIPVIGLVRLCHYSLNWLAGRMLIQATSYLRRSNEEYALACQRAGGKELIIQTEDGVYLSAYLVRPELPTNNWVVSFNPTSCVFQDFLAEEGTDELIKSTKSNFLLFNYRGTKGSSGSVSRNGLLIDAEAIFRFIEEQGAEKIIYWGLSLGGAVSTKAMSLHEQKGNIEYIGVNERSFSKFSLGAGRTVRIILQQYLWKPIANLVSYIVPYLVYVSNWEIDALSAWQSITHRKIVAYHKWDEMMDHESGLGYALEGSEADIVVLGEIDDGPMDWWNHVPKYPEDALEIMERLSNEY